MIYRPKNNIMTLHESARFTVERLTAEYEENSCYHRPQNIYLWDLVKMIKNALWLEAINEGTAQRLCYHLNVTMEEMYEA